MKGPKRVKDERRNDCSTINPLEENDGGEYASI